MKTMFVKTFLLAVCLFGGIGLAQAFPGASDDRQTPPKPPRPPHCDPWYTGDPGPTPSPTPEPTFEPVPIGPGDGQLRVAPASQAAYGDCEDDEPEPSPTPSPDSTPTPPPSDDPDDPGEQTFPTDPGLFLHGSGTLFGCGLNPAATFHGTQGFWILGMIFVPALVRRMKS